MVTDKMKELGIIDEQCECGHLRSDHGVTTDTGGVHPENLTDYEMAGGGKCRAKDCGCGIFTWKSWVYEAGREPSR
jgi:hypothetical protein